MATSTYKKVVTVVLAVFCLTTSVHATDAAAIAIAAALKAGGTVVNVTINNATSTAIEKGAEAAGAALKAAGPSGWAYFGAAAIGLVGGFFTGDFFGRKAGKYYVEWFDAAVEIMPTPLLATMAQQPTQAMRLEYITYAVEALHSPRMQLILDDLIEKSRVLLAKQDITQDELNACLRWAILVSRSARGLNLLNQVLEAGAHVNHVDRYGNTPMVLAIQFYMHSAVKKFLEKGVDLAVVTAGVTPDMFARQRLHAAHRTLPSDRAFAMEFEAENVLGAITRYKQEHNSGNNDGNRRA